MFFFKKKKFTDINQVKDEFLKIEEKHKIFDESFVGYHYWDFVRTYVFFSVVDKVGFYEKSGFTKPIDILGDEPIDLPHLNELKTAKSLVIWNNLSERHIIPKESFNKDTHYVILNKGSQIKKELSNINEKMFYWMFDLKEEDKILKHHSQMQKYSELKPLHRILAHIRKTFNIGEESFKAIYDKTFVSVFYNINYTNKIKRDYSRFEDLETIYVTLPMYKYFSAAYRGTNVRIIEIQHGVMPSYDIKYNYPAHANSENTYNPDVIYVNAPYWKEYSNNKYISELEVVKSPFLARDLAHTNQFDDNKVLFISQWNLSNKIAELAVDYAANNPEKTINVRLHPAEEEDVIKKLIETNNVNNIVISEEKDVYKDLATHRHVVGVISTVIWQAVENQNKVYIYDLYNNQGFLPFYENSLAKKVEDSKQLTSCVNEDWAINVGMATKMFKRDIPSKKL